MLTLIKVTFGFNIKKKNNAKTRFQKNFENTDNPSTLGVNLKGVSLVIVTSDTKLRLLRECHNTIFTFFRNINKTKTGEHLQYIKYVFKRDVENICEG